MAPDRCQAFGVPISLITVGGAFGATARRATARRNGYLLTVACPCGVTFERWVTPLDAELDLLQSASLN